MQTALIDNSIADDMRRVITWQYDNATRLIGLVAMIKSFYDTAVGGAWNKSIDSVFNLYGADSFGLSVWASNLGLNRPTYTPASTGESTPISDRFFGNLLKGRMFMLRSNFSTDQICQYLQIVYNHRFAVYDNLSASVTFKPYNKTGETVTRYEEEDWLAANHPEIAFVCPAGVSMSYSAT